MLKIGLRIIAIVALIGLGFLIRGFLPTGGPPPDMMGMGAMPPPAVVAKVLEETPLDMLDEYIAMIEPIQDVMVRTEVAGYITQVHFTEGAFVEEGDLLFTIDQRQYLAVVEVRQAELARARAEEDRTEKYLKRLRNANERSVSESEHDTAESAQLQAVALLAQAKANLNLAQIDLAYSEICAPISGRIGAAMVTKGNYVTSASDTLARIVQVDPIRVVFSMTDRAYLNHRQEELSGINNGRVAQVRLPNGTRLPLVGKKDFDDNEMSSSTGTMAVRYIFSNPDSLLVSGGYVTLLLGKPERPMGIRIPQQSVLVDPQGSYVLTVNDEGLVGTARVELGASVESDVIAVSGLQAGDRVVVEGVQKVQPGVVANVTLLENP